MIKAGTAQPRSLRSRSMQSTPVASWPERSRTVQQKDQHRHIGEGATANDQTQVRLIELVVFIQGHGQNPFHQAALLP